MGCRSTSLVLYFNLHALLRQECAGKHAYRRARVVGFHQEMLEKVVIQTKDFMLFRPLLVAGAISAPLAVVFLSACSSATKVEARAGSSQKAPTVAVARATTEDLSQELVLTAEFRPFRKSR